MTDFYFSLFHFITGCTNCTHAHTSAHDVDDTKSKRISLSHCTAQQLCSFVRGAFFFPLKEGVNQELTSLLASEL